MQTDSHFLTTDHDLHRRRRKPLEPFFSRSGVLRLQPLLAETIEKLANRFEEVKETGSIIRLDHAFFALSGDVVGKLCWAEKEEFLDDLNFAPEWYCPVRMAPRALGLQPFKVRPYTFNHQINLSFSRVSLAGQVVKFLPRR